MYQLDKRVNKRECILDGLKCDGSIICGLCKRQKASQKYIQCCDCYVLFHVECVKERDVDLPLDEYYCKSCKPRHILGTCWIPIGDVEVKDGALAILSGSKSLPYYDT